MASDVYSGSFGEIRAASTAGGGTALTTTAVCVQLPVGTKHLFIEGRNYSTAVVVQVALNPFMFVLRTQDNLATATDYSDAAQDKRLAIGPVWNSQDTGANGDYYFIGSHLPFRGVNIDVLNTNGNASVLTVDYWDGNSWETTSATDGTASAGATLAVDGSVTWTVPLDWTAASLLTINTPAPGAGVAYRSNVAYWTRWSVSAALDSSVFLSSMSALNRSTDYLELVANRPLELRVVQGPGGVGCVEAKTDAGTANLIVDCAVPSGGKFAF